MEMLVVIVLHLTSELPISEKQSDGSSILGIAISIYLKCSFGFPQRHLDCRLSYANLES